jgi:transcriptional regulator with XRE-family HTH domain
MTRNRDRLIDKKMGSVIRMQRVKLRMSQSDLGNSLGVTFQQIQKYENGGNAVASTRIPALCQTLEISPNDLFGVSARMDGELSHLGYEDGAQNTGAVAGDATNGRWTA